MQDFCKGVQTRKLELDMAIPLVWFQGMPWGWGLCGWLVELSWDIYLFINDYAWLFHFLSRHSLPFAILSYCFHTFWYGMDSQMGSWLLVEAMCGWSHPSTCRCLFLETMVWEGRPWSLSWDLGEFLWPSFAGSSTHHSFIEYLSHNGLLVYNPPSTPQG